MASATFDTLHAAKALTAAGFAAPQAEAITDTIREAFTESVATKAEIAEVKAEIAEVKADLAEVKAELKTDIATLEAAVAADIAEVKVDIAEVKAELKADIAGLYKHLWLMGLGIVTAVAAIVKLL